ncbi:hypothetical protein B0H16DRAFT_1512947 [Mycena metata]|uniref:F-box domain-containing protein n=1 Tax=Mycena metata TaxID=1033252 RepID=A0AAD7NRV5_9AGAR|nr:hypothetical protein B0H16DRAFT_1512947 [Mycena metata]
MHPALEIREIVQSVFGHVGRPSSGYDLKTLAMLARTCTAFCDPALDLLWAEQHNLKALMGCFPGDLFLEVDLVAFRRAAPPSHFARRIVQDLGIRRPITKEDWDRPLLYSHRVKALYLDNSIGTASASTSAFYDICLAFPGSHLFPNLRTLQADLSSAYREIQPARVIPFLLAPGIERITIALRQIDTASHFLPTLPQRCPSITYLDISNWDNGDTQSSSAVVQNLPQMQELRVYSLNRQALEYVRRLPTLKTLLIEDFTVDLPVDDNADAHSYSSLKDLEFGRTRVHRVTEFLKITRNCSLQRLHIGSFESETATAANMASLFSTLAAQRCSHTSLRTIRYHTRSSNSPPSDPDIYALTGHMIRPLFRFTNMVTVTIYQPCGLDITDDDVSQLASAWPCLEFLSLGGIYQVASRVTLHALYVLASHCPRLLSLSISLDATLVPALLTSIFDHPLQYIYVGRAAITEPAPVARYIATMFPATRVKAWADIETPRNSQETVYHGRWRIVSEDLVTIQSSNHT